MSTSGGAAAGIASLAGPGLTEKGGELDYVDASGTTQVILGTSSGGFKANGDVYADGMISTTSYAGGVETSAGSYSGDFRFSLLLVDASGGAATVVIPTAAAPPTGWHWTIKKTDSSANHVTVSWAGGTIDGAASVALTAQNEALTMQFDGTNWWVAGEVATSIL